MHQLAGGYARRGWRLHGGRPSLRNSLADQQGRFALLRGRKVVAFFDDPAVAAAEAWARFGDGLFAIRAVDDEGSAANLA